MGVFVVVGAIEVPTAAEGIQDLKPLLSRQHDQSFTFTEATLWEWNRHNTIHFLLMHCKTYNKIISLRVIYLALYIEKKNIF